MSNINQFVIDSNSTIYNLTEGQYRSLRYNPVGTNYTGPLVREIMNLIKRAGGDVTNTNIDTVGAAFTGVITKFQSNNNLPVTGVLDDSLLHYLYDKANENSNNEIIDDSDITYEYPSAYSNNLTYNPHYDPFFLNSSSKAGRKNHKDIVIEFGDGSNKKLIKDVFMRSVSVQVDTSGNPISEVYSFIARDIKEYDADEDINKYIGESEELTAPSDIVYEYQHLFDDP